MEADNRPHMLSGMDHGTSSKHNTITSTNSATIASNQFYDMSSMDPDSAATMLTSMAISNISVSLETPPNFVRPPEEKYLCVYCKNILRPKVKQTLCGHRLCEKCVPELFNGCDTPLCPGNDDCVDLHITEIHPDIATTKELLRMLVYCPYKENGCSATVKWSALQQHEQTCGYALIQCKNPGCTAMVLRSQLQQHEEHDCDFLQTLCPKCEQLVSRKDLQDGHSRTCKPKPKKCLFSALGCDFEGTVEELKQHRIDSDEKHTLLLVTMTAKLSQDKEFFEQKQEEFLSKLNDLQTHIESVQSNSHDGKKLQAVQKSVAKIGEDVINIKESLKEKADQDQVVECTSKISEIQNIARAHESRLGYVEQGAVGGGGGMGEEFGTKFSQVQSSVDMYGQRIAEHDIRFRLLETAGYDGEMIWKITNYSRRKQDALEGRTLSLYSQPFYTSRYGYKMCTRAYLNGDGMGRGSHLSLFFVVMRGEYDVLLPWPFRQKVTLSLLDQSGSRRHIKDTFRPDPTSTSFKRPVNEMNIASGSPLFAAQSVVESDLYLKHDTIFIRVTVDTSDLANTAQ